MRLADVSDIFEIRSDPLVREKYGREPVPSLAQVRRWIGAREAGRRKRDNIFWVFVAKGKAVGSCCFWNFDAESRCAELGYELNRAYWHKGIASEALPPVIVFGFDGIGLNRIEACPLVENGASNGLLKKLGFIHEGTLRRRILFRGRYIDQAYYSLLRDDPRPFDSGSP